MEPKQEFEDSYEQADFNDSNDQMLDAPVEQAELIDDDQEGIF